MLRMTITDSLDQTVFAVPFTDDFPLERATVIARREAAGHVRGGGRVRWTITDQDGRERAAGEEAVAPAGLLPIHTPVLYAEADAGGPGVSVFGTIRGVQAGCYVVAVDHIDCGGRPVEIAAIAELRVPVDTPADGAPRTLSALVLGHQVAAE